LTRNPISRAAIWAGVASPRMTAPNTSVVWGSVRGWRSARAAIAWCSGRAWGGTTRAQGSGFRACQSYPEKSRFVKCHNGLRALIDPPLQPIFRRDEPALPRRGTVRRGRVRGLAAATGRAHGAGGIRGRAGAPDGPPDGGDWWPDAPTQACTLWARASGSGGRALGGRCVRAVPGLNALLPRDIWVERVSPMRPGFTPATARWRAATAT